MSRRSSNLARAGLEFDPAQTARRAAQHLGRLPTRPENPDPYQKQLQDFTVGVLVEAMRDHRCFGPEETNRILLKAHPP